MRIERDAFYNHLGSGGKKCRYHRKGRGRGIARHCDRTGCEFRFAGQADGESAILSGFKGDMGAESLEHTLGVVSRGRSLDHGGNAGRIEPCQEDG